MALSVNSFKSKGLLSIRGGKSKKSLKKSPAVKTRNQRNYDENDDEDEDEDEDKSVSKKFSKHRKGQQLVPWGSSSQSTTFSNIRETIEEFAKKGKSAYKDVYRRAKVLRSSAFEGMLLKATWPGNDPIPKSLLIEIVKHSIPSFRYSQSVSDDDPYHMTLHKIWTKLLEKDWRTTTKSLFLLHSISRDSAEDTCNEFAEAINQMSKHRSPKNPTYKYFDQKAISVLDENGKPYKALINSYSGYVLYRLKNFSSKFLELQDIDAKSSEKEVIALLKKAQRLVELGLKVISIKKPMANGITGQALRLVAIDLKELWHLLSLNLAPFVNNTSSYQGSKATAEDISSLLKFHKETQSDLQTQLNALSKIFNPFGIKISTDISKQISSAQLEEAVKKLSSISGGSTSDQAKSRTDDDDDEEEGADEEEIEEDEDEGGEGGESEENEIDNKSSESDSDESEDIENANEGDVESEVESKEKITSAQEVAKGIDDDVNVDEDGETDPELETDTEHESDNDEEAVENDSSCSIDSSCDSNAEPTESMIEGASTSDEKEEEEEPSADDENSDDDEDEANDQTAEEEDVDEGDEEEADKADEEE